jgi:hypothetical protein
VEEAGGVGAFGADHAQMGKSGYTIRKGRGHR